MKTDEIRWQVVSVESLPEILLRKPKFPYGAMRSLGSYDLGGRKVAAAYTDGAVGKTNSNPCMLVIDDEASSETLSWVRVYAQEIFPLSQYARVIGFNDWAEINSSGFYREGSREDIWASVVLGEILGQGEQDSELSAVPLSRAGACFSMAMARTSCLIGGEESERTCVERLKKLETDGRFVKRQLSVGSLEPIWVMARMNVGEAMSVNEAASFVLGAIERISVDSSNGFSAGISMLKELSEFRSDSIEERVISFKRLIDYVTSQEPMKSLSSVPAALLAVGAFLVGRGTSHEFLLRRIAKKFPESYAWFGLIAALTGPEAWDPSWARAAKAVERQIRSRFDWGDYGGFDMCWIEYLWVSKTFDSADAFSEIPKLFPRVLSIEVMPGAVCQLRLAAANAGAEADARSAVVSARERDLQLALSQFLALANRIRPIMEDRQSGAGIQRSLLPESSVEPSQKQRPRRPRTPYKE